MKKKFFKKLSCVGIAAIMGLSTIGLSGCAFLFDVAIDLYDFAYRLTHKPLTDTERIENLEGRLYLSEEQTLLDVVDHETNPVSLLYLQDNIELGEGTYTAVYQYTAPIEEHFQDTPYWLPLPLEGAAKTFFDESVAPHFTEANVKHPNEMTGYWFYYNYDPHSDFDMHGRFLGAIDPKSYIFNMTGDYHIAWYDVETMQTCYFSSTM
jgi:hypothetical protein